MNDIDEIVRLNEERVEKGRARNARIKELEKENRDDYTNWAGRAREILGSLDLREQLTHRDSAEKIYQIERSLRWSNDIEPISIFGFLEHFVNPGPHDSYLPLLEISVEPNENIDDELDVVESILRVQAEIVGTIITPYVNISSPYDSVFIEFRNGDFVYTDYDDNPVHMDTLRALYALYVEELRTESEKWSGE